MRPLLTTKLYVPQMTESYIEREDITEKLTTGFYKNHQVSLVCAPAGYGKTTGVLGFLNKVGITPAWISLDEGDNDTLRFLSYLAAALNNAGAGIGSDITALISDINIANPYNIMTLMINSVVEYKDKIILVLDDYHILRSERIDELLTFLLEHQPLNLHIIIITREDPKLPLAKLRMKGKLTEIRYGELLFTKQEAEDFIQKETQAPLSSEKIDRITSKTEGWIAGLQLAALIIKEYPKDRLMDFLNEFDGTNSYIIDYLVEEVMEHLDKELKYFLCWTSVLERMNDRLCDELLGRTDSKEILYRLEKKNLFLIPLDDKKEWYRYHHLFADSLKTYLSEEEKKELYKKASIWLKNNGFSQEAVRYAFLSGDQQYAVQMIENSTEEAFQTAQLETFLAWLEKLPVKVVIGNEIFCVRKGIALFITGKIREGIDYLNQLGPEFIQTASEHNKGLLLLLQAMLAGTQGKDAETLAGKALTYLEAWDPISRISAMNSLGRARLKKGNTAGALEAFEQAYEGVNSLGYQFVTTLALMNYSSCLLITGQDEKALELCNKYMAGMGQQYDRLPPYIGVIYLVMSGIYSLRKDSEKARYYKETGNKLCNIISFDGEGTLRIFEAVEEALNKNTSQAVALDYGEKLSERETEILLLLLKGLTNQEIADALFITINTAQWHLSHIYAKLGVKNRTQAMLKAKELGFQV